MSLTKERSAVHSTFVIEKRYPASPERVFAALADPVKKRRWFAESDGFEVQGFEMDFRVEGVERSGFRFVGGPGNEQMDCSNYTVFLDIVPNQRVVLAYTMTMNGRRISSSLATFDLMPDANGTELVFTEQAAFFEGADGPEIRKKGWEDLLDHLHAELKQTT